jgi:methionyl-tRNA formyltransferase
MGATDLTRAIAERLPEAGIRLAGVVSPPEVFRISYSEQPVRNSRHADMAGWCRARHVYFSEYAAADDVARAARETGAAAALAAGWYHHVPARVRVLFPRGCAALHASLLPKYRGGAPLTWALLNGDAEAGVSLFELSDDVDAGPLFDQRRFRIDADDYIGDLVQKAEAATLEMLDAALPAILTGDLRPRPQQGEPSYSLQRQPSDGAIDWRQPAAEIARLIRSVSRPYPGARTMLDGTLLTIWRAHVAELAPPVHGAPGQVVNLRELPLPAIVTGAGLLLVEDVEGMDGFNLQALANRHQQRLTCAGTGSRTR